MNDYLMPVLAVLAFFVGAALAWLLAAGARKTSVAAAVARTEAAGQTELVQLRERVRAGDESRRVEQESFAEARRQADAVRGDLARARDEIATLVERTSRVPTLEQAIARLSDDLRASGAEVLRASSEAAQSGQAVSSLTRQVTDLEAVRNQLATQFEQATQALAAVGERKAALEEQTVRIPTLEREVATTAAEVDRLDAQLTNLREAAGAESARLVAERSAHGLVRDELVQVKSALDDAERTVARVNTQLTDLRESNGAEIARLAAEREALALVRTELAQERAVREATDAELGRLHGELTELRTRLETERDGAAAKLALLLDAKEALTDQFKSLAADILEEKSKRFAEQNQATLGQLLAPLRTQLVEFKGKVEEVYVQEGKDRSALSEQVRQLVGLNQALSQDAKNLTLALKGSAKTQGNWGELVLERVLEASGLRKGHEYHVQESQQREDGTRAQADVVINLPEERRLVVDAKVSLVAYEAHTTAATDEDRGHAVRRHLDSVRTHIRGLSGKQYQTLYGLKSLDFVLMFIPVEPAFMMAVTHDNEIFMDAWERNVLLVSPSTLLFVVRTVKHLWRQEDQRNNYQEIAKRGAELYDRLVGFVDDLQAVGNRLGQAQVAFESAQRKLSVGKGNVIRQAEMLKGLGVKPSKSLPASLIELAAPDEGALLEAEGVVGRLPAPRPAAAAVEVAVSELQAGAGLTLPR